MSNKYNDIFAHRLKIKQNLDNNLKLQAAYDKHYKNNPVDYINDWGVTFDPRNDGEIEPKLLPFMLFPKQIELIEWLQQMMLVKKGGVVDKSRGVGATWTVGAFKIHQWKYRPGFIGGFGSRKADLVDRLGSPDSIFEKLRTFIRYIPYYFLPTGFSLKNNCFYMKIINPENHSAIIGEAGKNIGRGGRSSVYSVDEKAFLENEESTEAALSINTDVQIDISTHNGTDTIFYEKTKTFPTDRVFEMYWYDDTRRDQNWYDGKKREYEELGMMHLFAQEIDKNPDATKDRILIPNLWIRACEDAHKKIFEKDDKGNDIPVIKDEGSCFAGLDVADEGTDKNAISIKRGCIVKESIAWAGGDSNDITNEASGIMKKFSCFDMSYDGIGVGAGIKASSKTNKYIAGSYSYKSSREVSEPNLKLVEGHKNKDMFANAKAQDWWSLRLRFFNTYNAINGKPYNKELLISLDSNIKQIKDLMRELSQPTFSHNDKGQIIVDKIGKDSSGRKKRKSPNLADSLTICFAKPQIDQTYSTASTGIW